jgi:hypothetical protein
MSITPAITNPGPMQAGEVKRRPWRGAAASLQAVGRRCCRHAAAGCSHHCPPLAVAHITCFCLGNDRLILFCCIE